MASIGTIIDRQLRRWDMERRKKLEVIESGKKPEPKPILTVSRQRGSRGSYLAEILVDKLGYQLLHREIIDEICNSSGYRRQVIESLDDRTRSNIELWFDGMVKGQYVDASNYLMHLLKVIRSISAHSGVVIVGRGANFILTPGEGYHVRVIADVNTRIENLIKYQGMDREEAKREVKMADKGRSEFIRNNFKRDINDPAAYDVVINTTYTGIDEAFKMVNIGLGAKTKLMNSRE